MLFHVNHNFLPFFFQWINPERTLWSDLRTINSDAGRPTLWFWNHQAFDYILQTKTAVWELILKQNIKKITYVNSLQGQGQGQGQGTIDYLLPCSSKLTWGLEKKYKQFINEQHT